MCHRRPASFGLVWCLLCLIAVPAVACRWDYDTLRDERRGLPGAAVVGGPVLLMVWLRRRRRAA